MNFTTMEREQAYSGLNGTIAISPAGDVNRTAKSNDNTIFYLQDSIKLLALAADSFLRKKARETNMLLNETIIVPSDDQEYGRQVAATSFNGKTGQIAFSNNSTVRQTSVFRIVNIFSCNNSNGSEYINTCNSVCVGQVDGQMVRFFDTNSSTGFTNISTIVFSDGTKDIPSDCLQRYFSICEF